MVMTIPVKDLPSPPTWLGQEQLQAELWHLHQAETDHVRKHSGFRHLLQLHDPTGEEV